MALKLSGLLVDATTPEIKTKIHDLVMDDGRLPVYDITSVI